jgi:hypothetical protein
MSRRNLTTERIAPVDTACPIQCNLALAEVYDKVEMG